MASMARRIVDKWLADKIEDELTELREGGLNGAGTVFASLARIVQLHPSDMKRVESEFERAIVRLRRSADLPKKWIHVREALESRKTKCNCGKPCDSTGYCDDCFGC